MRKTHLLNFKTAKPTLSLLLLAFAALLFTNIVLTSCDDNEYEHRYWDYGVVDSLDVQQYVIRLDGGDVIIPTNGFSRLSDSLRVWVDFSIEEESDTTRKEYKVELHNLVKVLTKPILPHDETILDSLGNDPLEIDSYWIANGFINFKFYYYASGMKKHMVNLMQLPSQDGKIILEFRHNAFKDYASDLFRSDVSFRLGDLLDGMEKPVSIEVLYSSSPNSTKSITLTYK